MNSIRLQDAIDVKIMQDIQDAFANLTGMAALTVDIEGNPFTKMSVPGGSKMSKPAGAADLKNGTATITVNRQKLGTVLIGQGAGGDVPQRQIESAVSFLNTLVRTVGSLAGNRQASSGPAVVLEGTAQELNQRIVDIEGLINANSENNRKLFSNFGELSQIAQSSVKKVTDTKETVKLIQDIAMNTRILGFNASIEASRSKESGKGFGVIAQEVRSLADVSKQSADKIEDTIQALVTDTDEISGGIKNTEEIVHRNMEYAEQISELLQEVLTIAQKMK